MHRQQHLKKLHPQRELNHLNHCPHVIMVMSLLVLPAVMMLKNLENCQSFVSVNQHGGRWKNVELNNCFPFNTYHLIQCMTARIWLDKPVSWLGGVGEGVTCVWERRCDEWCDVCVWERRCDEWCDVCVGEEVWWVVWCVCGRGGMMRGSYIKCLKTIVFHNTRELA